MAEHNELGKEGEKIALQFLQEKGYTILEQNYQFKKAEIDIIAQYKEQLIIVEVKTRTNTYVGNPQDFVSPKKIKLLVGAADNYIQENDIDLEARFDIVAVVKNQKYQKVEHLEDAFYFF